MCDVSSARPARLRYFRTTSDGIAEGITRRVSPADSAIDGYVSGNEYAYRVDVSATLEAVTALAGTLRSLGEWVGAIGDAFAAISGDDLDSVQRLGDATIIEELPEDLQDDPYRLDELLTPEMVGWAPEDGEDPPPWLDPLQGTDTILDWTEPALASALGHYLQRVSEYTRANGVQVGGYVRFDPRYGGKALLGPFATASQLDSLGRWVGRAGVGISFFSGAAEQWFSDDGMDTGDRAVRAATMGTGTAAGSGLGAWGGAALAGGACAAGVVTAPAAPLCALGGGIIGGLGGGAIGSWVADQMPWMDDPDPAERDYDDLVEEIESFDVEPVQEIVPQVNRVAQEESSQNQAMIDALILDPDLRIDMYPDGPTGPLYTPIPESELQEMLDLIESGS